jgi:hypothetical protein
MHESNPAGSLGHKNFSASQMSINAEPFQRTDISMKPLSARLLISLSLLFEVFSAESLWAHGLHSSIVPYSQSSFY